MIGWLIRNFISREVNVLKFYKTLIRHHIEYCTQAWKLECNIEIGGYTKKSYKNEVKDYSYWERLEKLGLATGCLNIHGTHVTANIGCLNTHKTHDG